MTDGTIKNKSPAPGSNAPSPANKVSSGLLALLIAMNAIGPLTLQMPAPALPAIARYFGEDIAVAQLAISLFLLGLACSQLIAGPLSDKFGRRPVMLGGLLLTVASNVAVIFATTLPEILVARVFQALGSAAGLAISRAMVRDLYDRDRAASMIGIVVGAMMIAPMVGPLIGGLIDTTLGWRMIFYVLCAVSIALLIWAWLTLPETRRIRTGSDAAGLVQDVRALFASRSYWGFVMCQALASGAIFMFQAGGAFFVINQIGRSSAEYGFWFALGAVAYMAGNFSSARLTLKIGGHRMIWIGLTLQIVGGAINLVWGLSGLSINPAYLFITHMLIAFGNGYVMTNTTAGAVSVRPQAAGTAAGMLGFVQMAVSAVASQIGAHLGGEYATTVPLNLGVLILLLLSALVAALMLSRKTSGN